MKRRHVSFTFTAPQHVAQEKAWWLANRDDPEVFVEGLEQAVKVGAVLPGAGTLYARSPIPGVRRVYLRRVALRLYYTLSTATLFNAVRRARGFGQGGVPPHYQTRTPHAAGETALPRICVLDTRACASDIH